MSGFRFRLVHCAAAWFVASLLLPSAAVAGSPKYVAGVSYFNSGVLGQPVHWANGQLNYYVDQGPLNASVTNKQATAMVDAAAALWSAVTTAGVTLADKGPLNENVSGSNLTVGGTGFTVTLYQALYAWAATCPTHGRCDQSELLATESSTAISALDGSVTFSPASLADVATNMTGIAVTGDTSSVNIAIERHP